MAEKPKYAVEQQTWNGPTAYWTTLGEFRRYDVARRIAEALRDDGRTARVVEVDGDTRHGVEG